MLMTQKEAYEVTTHTYGLEHFKVCYIKRENTTTWQHKSTKLKQQEKEFSFRGKVSTQQATGTPRETTEEKLRRLELI